MDRARAIQLAELWSEGCLCTLRHGEAKEYHMLFLAALREQEQREQREQREQEPKVVEIDQFKNE